MHFVRCNKLTKNCSSECQNNSRKIRFCTVSSANHENVQILNLQLFLTVRSVKIQNFKTQMMIYHRFLIDTHHWFFLGKIYWTIYNVWNCYFCQSLTISHNFLPIPFFITSVFFLSSYWEISFSIGFKES